MPEKILIYEIFSNDSSDMAYKIKVFIPLSNFCKYLDVSSELYLAQI